MIEAREALALSCAALERGGSATVSWGDGAQRVEVRMEPAPEPSLREMLDAAAGVHPTFAAAFLEAAVQLVSEGGGTLHAHAADCDEPEPRDDCPCRPVALDVAPLGTLARLELCERALKAVAMAPANVLTIPPGGLLLPRTLLSHSDPAVLDVREGAEGCVNVSVDMADVL